jgi:ribonuclease HI
MTEPGTSAGGGSGPKTRYHLLMTDAGIVPDQPGKMAGEAAIGVVLKAPLEEFPEPIGRVKDHHVAEYRALIRGLEVARSHGIRHLRVCLDSDLVVGQLTGRKEVLADDLKPLYDRALSLWKQFDDIEIAWVPREANTEADALACIPLGPLGLKRTVTETSEPRAKKAGKAAEWKSLPDADLAEYLLVHKTISDSMWTEEKRLEGEKRDAFIRRILGTRSIG